MLDYETLFLALHSFWNTDWEMLPWLAKYWENVFVHKSGDNFFKWRYLLGLACYYVCACKKSNNILELEPIFHLI